MEVQGFESLRSVHSQSSSARLPIMHMNAPATPTSDERPVEEAAARMEVKWVGENPRQLGDVHGSNGGISKNQTLDFEEMIRDIDEDIQFDPRVSISKEVIPNKVWGGLGSSSILGVDEVAGSNDVSIGSVYQGVKEITPVLETEVADFMFKVGWESSDVDKKSSNKGRSHNKRK